MTYPTSLFPTSPLLTLFPLNNKQQMAVRDRRMADDVSIIIADVLPPPTPGATPPQFPAAALKVGLALECEERVQG